MSKQAYDISGGIDLGGGQYYEFGQMVFYSILGWFTITIEAFVRYDFGERYYTKANCYVGFLLMCALFLIGSLLSYGFEGYNAGMYVLFFGYIIMSAYHFYRIWVNLQIGEPQHSFFSGRSRLEFLGKIIATLINPFLTIAALAISRFLLSSKNFKRLKGSLNVSPPIADVHKFTKLVIEPAVVLILAFSISGMLSWWLFLSGGALLVYSHLSYQIARNGELDIADNLVDAAFMKRDSGSDKKMRDSVSEIIKTVKKRAVEEPDFIENLKEEKPSLFDVLDELDIDLGTPDVDDDHN